MASARVVANRLIELARAEGRGLTPMQILKLVYIAHGWSLGLLRRPLIKESVEAWKYGPVIPELYRAMKGFGGDAVTSPLPLGIANEQMDVYQARIVDDVYRLYGHMTGPQLSRITHADNTPWQQSYEPGAYHCEIPTEAIADHYARLSRERSANANA